MQYHPRDQRIELFFTGIKVTMNLNSTTCVVTRGTQASTLTMPVAPTGNKGTAFVPARFIAEKVLGLQVSFAASGRIVIRGKPEAPTPTLPVQPQPTGTLAFRSVNLALREKPDIDKPTIWLGQPNLFTNLQTEAEPNKTRLVIARGWCPNPGYGIVAERVFVQDNRLVVQVKLIDPDPDAFYITLMHYAYQVIEVDNLPEVTAWELRNQSGAVLNRQDLTTLPQRVRYSIAAQDADVAWADLTTAGVESKLISQSRLLVVVKRGEQPSAGYDIRLRDVSLAGWGKLVAHVELTDPNPDDMVATVLTYPYVAFYVDAAYYGYEISLDALNLSEEIGFRVVEGVTLKPSVDLQTPGVVADVGRNLIADSKEYKNEYLLILKRGQCPTSGYGIEVSRIYLEEGILKVEVVEVDPDPDAFTLQVLTYPYQIIQIDRSWANYRIEIVRP